MRLFSRETLKIPFFIKTLNEFSGSLNSHQTYSTLSIECDDGVGNNDDENDERALLLLRADDDDGEEE